MAGASQRRAKAEAKQKSSSGSSRREEDRSSSHTTGHQRESPPEQSSGQRTSPSGSNQRSSPQSLGARYDGNRDDGAPVAGERDPNRTPKTQADLRVRDVDLGVTMWAAAHQVRFDRSFACLPLHHTKSLSPLL